VFVRAMTMRMGVCAFQRLGEPRRPEMTMPADVGMGVEAASVSMRLWLHSVLVYVESGWNTPSERSTPSVTWSRALTGSRV
jgi:hypothetical protein